MKPFVIILALSAISTIHSMAQKVDYYPIPSLDSGSFENFHFLKREIGSAQVVFLGEQHHGDGASMVGKTFMVEYLVQQMGFNAIVFEADFSNLNNSKKTADEKWNYLPGVWRKSDQMLRLKNFIENNQLEVAGVDLFGTFDRSAFIELFWSHASNQTTFKREILNPTIHAIFTGSKTKKEALKETIRLTTLLIDQSEGLDKQQFISFQFILKSYQGLPKKNKTGYEKYEERDAQMGLNLDWLVRNNLAGKKVIVWAANFHISKNPNAIDSDKKWRFKSGNLISMGSKFGARTNVQHYHIAFTAYTGQYTDWVHDADHYQDIKPDRHDPNALELWLSNQKVDFCFVPLHQYKAPFPLSGFAHKSYFGNWQEVFDAVFFINKMTPSTYQLKKDN